MCVILYFHQKIWNLNWRSNTPTVPLKNYSFTVSFGTLVKRHVRTIGIWHCWHVFWRINHLNDLHKNYHMTSENLKYIVWIIWTTFMAHLLCFFVIIMSLTVCSICMLLSLRTVWTFFKISSFVFHSRKSIIQIHKHFKEFAYHNSKKDFNLCLKSL